MTAYQRYVEMSSVRDGFLNDAYECSKLTLPYLIREDDSYAETQNRYLKTPWQGVGAKCVNTLSSKLMLALLPPNTSFFKLQVDDSQLGKQFDPRIKSELDMSFARVERMIMESIAASSDRVIVHAALKHLVVGGNVLMYMGKEGMKLFPFNRYCCERDGHGNVIEIVTKERISKKLLSKYLGKVGIVEPPVNSASGADQHEAHEKNCDVYTHVKRDNNRYIWYQEIYGKVVPGSEGKAPVEATPWLPLRMNTVDGEQYGRGRAYEYLGDLKSLEALSQALVEGSAAAAKVIFTVSPSSTTKPATLAQAGNGAIVQGRPDDIAVVQVGKTADFKTAFDMSVTLGNRLSEAFLVLNVRDSERTTAEEVRLTQLELEQQLGGIFSMLTVEFLVPYLNRKLMTLQKSGEIPKLPKGIVKPTIVAGVNGLGRGQDRESLTAFLTLIAQTLGPEAVAKHINPEEFLKRLAAAQGIDYLNLIRNEEEQRQLAEQSMNDQQALELTKQAKDFAKINAENNGANNPEQPQENTPPGPPPQAQS